MPGVPYLYMGDEVAFGGGSDPDMRRNMLFGEGLDDVRGNDGDVIQLEELRVAKQGK